MFVAFRPPYARGREPGRAIRESDRRTIGGDRQRKEIIILLAISSRGDSRRRRKRKTRSALREHAAVPIPYVAVAYKYVRTYVTRTILQIEDSPEYARVIVANKSVPSRSVTNQISPSRAHEKRTILTRFARDGGNATTGDLFSSPERSIAPIFQNPRIEGADEGARFSLFSCPFVSTRFSRIIDGGEKERERGRKGAERELFRGGRVAPPRSSYAPGPSRALSVMAAAMLGRARRARSLQ